ncbi:MAG: mechanosensitive ion channel [Alphaproteobacteria bacterium]|nr:mechanosensitive ion channel [Alphaproteobacteria bacterium]
MKQKIGKIKRFLTVFIQLGIWVIVALTFYYAWKKPEFIQKIFPGLELPTIDLSNVIKALIFVSLTLYIFGFLKKLLIRWVQNHPQNNDDIFYSMAKLVTYTGWIIAAWGTLSFLGLDMQNLAIVFGALSVGIGFGLQTIINNFVSGILILFERPISVGDWIQVSGQEGIVKNIRIRATELESFDKASVLIPNSSILSGDLVNLTRRRKGGRIIIPIGVSYNSNMKKVHDILLDCAQKTEGVSTKNPPFVWLTDFADSSVNFELRAYVDDVTKKGSVRSALMFAIWDAFEKNKIEIPFPQRVVHLDK